ncbi:MAG: hypothetical protein WCV81_04135 [Microgenomates group bacterium]|jgi:hypothetical protein
MKENESDLITQKIINAKHPEDVFGGLGEAADPLKTVLSTYRQLSKLTHPDLNGGVEAQDAFINLTRLWERAQEKIKLGTYGQIPPDVLLTIRTRVREYEIFDSFSQTDFCNVHGATYKEGGTNIPAIFKVAKSPLDNEFVENEAKMLRKLAEVDNFDNFRPYFPGLIDSFIFEDSNHIRKNINAFSKRPDELFSFVDVKNAYPKGIDQKDMAWIFRRVLVGLGFAHQNNLIHGAALPQNLFVQPEKHGLVINEWSYSVIEKDPTGGRLQALSGDWESWYPPEVFKKEPVSPGLDIYLGAKNMIYLLGGNPQLGELPSDIHPKIKAFFRGCLLPAKQRPKDAWGLLEEFDSMIVDLWGPKKFHVFSMPKNAKGGDKNGRW